MAGNAESPQELDLLKAELAEREGEIALLLETSRLIGSELELDKVFGEIAVSARTLIKAETVLVTLLTADRSAYTYRAGVGEHADEIVGQSLPIEFGLCGWVLRNKKPWWRGAFDELSTEERNQWEHEAGNVVLVPLLGRRGFLGGLAGINKQNGGDFTRRDFDLLQLFAAQAAIAIENAVAMEKVEQARREAEAHQVELQRMNRRLNAANLQLEQMSLFDTLTGLPNRSLFRDRVHHEIELAQATGGSLAILLIDINKFHDINSSYGQETGDILLKEVATQLNGMLKPGSTLSRVSGDEFAALIANANADTAASLGHAMNQRLAAGVPAGGRIISLGASIGVTLFPDHGNDLSALMKNADLAMEAAKRQRTDVHVFNPARDCAAEGRFALTQHLRDALERQEFALYYQPKLDLATGCFNACEALARWLHPQRGMVPPDMFITALEQTNLILPFTRWVLEAAMRQQERWRALGWDIRIAVNVPPIVLMNPEFMKHLDALPPHSGLTLEITENVFLGDLDRLAAVVAQVRERDIGLSIDDFGTGYSSLQRLRQTAVSEIKIDRSFVKDMLANKDDAVIVHSTIELAHNLGLQVVGEGVEDAATLAHLTQLGCDSVQGYHICRPLPPDAFENFISRAKWPPCWIARPHARA
jgi:diguanylate cyclase (GGDEF)-like protein